MDITTILESEEYNYLEQNYADVIAEAEQAMAAFPNYLKNFVLTHPEEFIAENATEMKKKISIFSEVACTQFLKEVSTILNAVAFQGQSEEEARANEINEAAQQELNEYL